MKKKGLSVFNKFVLLLNILAIAGLLLSYLSSHISPGEFWIMGIFGLSYPVLLFVNVLFIFYWIFVWRWFFILSSVAIAGGYSYLLNTFQLKGRVMNYSYTKGSRPVKILSYNVRLFDLYNWTKEVNTKQKIFRLIDETGPDLACIQEFYTADGHRRNQDSILHLLKMKYCHIELTNTTHKGRWGMATFSRYPITGRGKINFNTPRSNNLCIYTDIKAGRDTIRVYNVHFQSIRFADEDYEFMKKIGENKNGPELQASKKILKRLKIAYIKRAKQVDMVVESIRSSPYPVIVCGDFNDPPSSYTYHSIRSTLKDAFVESGRGLGNTYNGIFPSFRIDYILHDPKYSSYAFKTINRGFSDHFPITCIVDLKH